MTVDEIMTPDPAFLGPDDSVRAVIDLMFSLDIRHVPIVSGEELVGMISDRDVRDTTLPALTAFDDPESARKAYGQPVSNVMHTDLINLTREADVAEAIDYMLEQKIGALPVLEPGSRKLVGIVSYVDVLRVCRDLV